jgi:hypothetical protein
MRFRKLVLAMLILTCTGVIHSSGIAFPAGGYGSPGLSSFPPINGNGSLIIWSIPAGAQVSVGGEVKGVTPLTVTNLVPGNYGILITKHEYQPFFTNVTIRSGEFTTAACQLVPRFGQLRVESNPANASISVDGRPEGMTPLTRGDILTGLHTITVSKIGFEKVNKTITVTAGRLNFVTVTLEPESAGSEKIGGFVDSLRNAGFEVQEGKLEKFDIFGMYSAGYVPSCYQNNPSSPYMTYKLPSYPGLARGGRVTDSPLHPENKGLWVDYFMNPDEAIVFVGNTPPEVKYFSYRSYIGTRWSDDRNTYYRIFASLGDSLNNFRIRTLGTPGGFRGSPYDQLTMIITTADRGTGERVRSAAIAAGYPDYIINYDVIPSGLIRMGTNSTDDTITFIHRLAFFANASRGSQYVNSTPGHVFRITPAVPHPPDPYGVQRLIVRGTGDTSELNLMTDLSELRKSLIATYGSSMKYEEKKTSTWIPGGFDALQRESDALGDNRDASYLRNGDYNLSDDDFIIVYGVNHHKTGKATYSNIAPYGIRVLNGVAAVTDAGYDNSALSYLRGNKNASLFYAWKFARHCDNEPYCTEIPSCCGAYGIPVNESIFIGFRNYVEPSTGVGPEYSELLYDQAIRFSPG